jgi:hypothetical protein
VVQQVKELPTQEEFETFPHAEALLQCGVCVEYSPIVGCGMEFRPFPNIISESAAAYQLRYPIDTGGKAGFDTG